jgi:hypothetical protein
LTLNEGMDFSPAYPKDAAPPAPALGDLPDAGLIRVWVDYQIDPANEGLFRQKVRLVGRQRLRNGAKSWTLLEQNNGRFREVFAYATRGEYERQVARLTKADLKLQQEAIAFHVGPSPVHPVLEQTTRIGWRGERML